MYYVGLDVHTRRSALEVLDQNGGLVKRLEVRGPWPVLLEKVAELPRPFAICYEASCGYGYLHEKLSTMAQRVAVAHPGQLRLIFRAKKKNDRVDAGKMAKLLYLNEVPEVHVPGADVRAWRALIEYRRKIVSKVVKVKNQIRALLRGLGIANCFIESWIGSMKRECLNHFWCWSIGHLNHIVAEYVRYHNTHRPHQGLGNVPIPERDKELKFQDNTEPIGKIGCQQWLGGLIKSYHREAA